MKSHIIKLNSYKADTSSIEKQLSTLKSVNLQLQSTVVSHNEQNRSLHLQIERLREQNQMQGLFQPRLRLKVEEMKISSQAKKNYNAYKKRHTELQTVIDCLQKKLEQSSAKYQEYKLLYEIEVKNNKNLQVFFQKKEKEWQQSISSLVSKYEQIIEQQEEHIQEQTVSISDSQQRDHLQPSLQLLQDKKTSIGNQITSAASEHENYEDNYMSIIRKVFLKFKDQGISIKQISFLPQVKTLKSVLVVNQSHIQKLLGSFPFDITDKEEIYGAYKFIEVQLSRKNMKISGNHIVNLVIEKLEQQEFSDIIDSNAYSNSDIPGEKPEQLQINQQVIYSQNGSRKSPLGSELYGRNFISSKCEYSESQNQQQRNSTIPKNHNRLSIQQRF